MVTIWNDLKDKLKIWGNVAVEKAETFGKVAATKTEELTKIGKIKLEIHQLQRDLEKNYSELGKFAYDSAEANVTNFSGNDQFVGYLQKAKEIKKQIQQKKEQIEKIKEEFETANLSEVSDESESVDEKNSGSSK